MRLAVLSDIHSNLDAFQAVLNDIKAKTVDDIISLGDNIGYGAQPEEVIVYLKRYNIISVLGNHELAFLDQNFRRTFNPFARKALEINKSNITHKAKKYISSLNRSMEKYNCRFVHGLPPDDVTTYISKETDQRIVQLMQHIKQPLTFVGHTHQLGIYELVQGNLKKKKFMKVTVSLAKEAKYIINTGSVGQPRDGYNEAKYVIWDSLRNTIEPRFVSYDYYSAAQKIKKAGIPKRYADVLIKAKR
jgi:predicted phosphodiesterase